MLRYLSAPPTSSASERLFSAADDIYSNQRMQLASERAEMLLFIINKKNYLHTLYNSDIYLATASHSIQNKHIQYTSHTPTQVFCIAQPLSLSYNLWYRYRYSYRYRRWKKVSGIGSIGKSWCRSQPNNKSAPMVVTDWNT